MVDFIYDQEGAVETATGPNGGVLEGVIDLGNEFGSLPEEIRVAVAHFSSADGDGDGRVDRDDYILWRDNYGQASSSAESGNSVPEPGSLLLVGSALLAYLLTRYQTNARLSIDYRW